MNKQPKRTPAAYELGGELAVEAMRIVQHCEHHVGSHRHEMRALFEDAIDLMQRQAKRVALEAFDQAYMQDQINQQRAESKH